MNIETKFSVGHNIWRKSIQIYNCNCCGRKVPFGFDVGLAEITLVTAVEFGGLLDVKYEFDSRCPLPERLAFASEEEAREELNIPKQMPHPKYCDKCQAHLDREFKDSITPLQYIKNQFEMWRGQHSIETTEDFLDFLEAMK